MSASSWPPGLITPLVTPLRDDALDIDALASLIEHQIDAGAAGVVVGGGSGEFGALSVGERRTLAGEVAAVLEGRLPFVVQTGALATKDAVALSVHAEEVGAAGTLLASPFGEPINWRERQRFYEELDAASSLPIMIYNTPPAGLLSMSEVEALAALPHVTAIKDSSGDVTFLGDLLTWSAENDFAVYVGFDSLVSYGAAHGARGTVLGVANVIPAEIVEVLQLSTLGEISEELRLVWEPLRAFLRFMEDSSNYVALCKYGLGRDGLDVGGVRAPYLMPFTDERQAFVVRLDAVRRAFTRRSESAAS